MALPLSGLLSFSHPIFQIFWFLGKEKPKTSINAPSQGLELALGGPVRDQEEGFLA